MTTEVRVDSDTAAEILDVLARYAQVNLATWHYAIDDYGVGPRRYRKVLAATPASIAQRAD
ncbi:hypothetical protein [Rhodococcus sp. 06-418-5]|uniref:hypothetical protein n=1 Tax=Rhodococcus sp. 06-418-5 TaxID=2022507 RepID=UPI00211AF00A|nr:hypothetical protein [Rhodococcus sp. 06-418-5]